MITVAEPTAPTIKGVKGLPKSTEVKIFVAHDDVNVILEEIQVNGETFPVEGIVSTIRTPRISVTVAKSGGVSVFIRPKN